ncbi:unnamed protein product [Trichobilharzia regenti]|nr:unnamed protein product [Trichobilharzia regenti]
MVSQSKSRELKREVKDFEPPYNANTCDPEDCNRAPPVMSSTPPTTSTSTPAEDMIQAMIAAFRIELMTSDKLSSSSRNKPKVEFRAEPTSKVSLLENCAIYSELRSQKPPRTTPKVMG